MSVNNFENAAFDLGISVTKLKAVAPVAGEDSGDPVAWDDVTDKPAVIAAGDTAAEARAAIGAGTSNFDGAYSSLSGRPTLGTAAAAAASDFATAAQGALADSAVQPGELAAIATSGAVTDLTGFPGGTSDFLRADGSFAAPPTSGSVSWDAVTDKPAVIAAGATQAAARSAIGAGTSNFDGSYNSLSDKPSIPAVEVVTEYPDPEVPGVLYVLVPA